MEHQVDRAERVVEVLSAFLAAGDRRVTDRYGAAAGLFDLVVETFRNSPEASALLARFQQEPDNPGVRMAIRGWISEGLLNSSEFADQLTVALARVTRGVPGEATAHPSLRQAHFTGNAAAVNGNAGRLSIRQRSVKIGRLQVPVPVFALLLLLGGSAVVGGSVAVVNAGSDAGDYAYYATTNENNEPHLIFAHWTTRGDGSLSGQFAQYDAGRSTPNLPGSVTGHQDGNKVSFTTSSMLFTVTLDATINGDTLTIQGFPGTPVVLTMQKTTPEQFDQIVNDFNQQHPPAG